MKTIAWKREPKGPGNAVHMFMDDAAGERVELLAYDCPACSLGPRMCGFEIYAAPKYLELVGGGEAASLDAAMRMALEMASGPRAAWTFLPRLALPSTTSQNDRGQP